ncbi:MAG: ABC transporter ATP-binding protein [Deltaproteobacteria bacterium]|jgi:spermidine/putrescine ABC transporter ATP-binding subunit|nr:ABC transporter ATP-binding protein [Deltaproteobacteria bacterium]MBT7204958.1 ABC transporter ATP-binding protein [Deltaproteobacteria bacterium]
MSFVIIEELTKTFEKTVAVQPLSLEIGQGEFFALLGPSGCGKSTTLRMLAGFIDPTAGRIQVQGQDITHLAPEARDIGIVFQNYAIFPHLSVYDNIAFGLVERKLPKELIRERVLAALEQVGLQGFEKRYEIDLSGGEKQRVALARVLVIEPRILLLDEPLSALDKKLREEMKLWIKQIQQQVGITTVYVTHDQGEALTMADRIGVMNQGRLLQVGTPQEIYEFPRSRFIGEFIGESNILQANVIEVKASECVLELLGRHTLANQIPESNLQIGQTVGLLLRPEMIRLEPLQREESVKLEGTVIDMVYLGALKRYTIDLGGQRLNVEQPNRPEIALIELGQRVKLYWNPQSTVVLP